MKWVNQVNKTELIEKAAKELKKVKEVSPPEWSMFVRTGADKERPPADVDWWYMRAASMMLKTAHLGPVGVSKLRTKYSGKKRRGHILFCLERDIVFAGKHFSFDKGREFNRIKVKAFLGHADLFIGGNENRTSEFFRIVEGMHSQGITILGIFGNENDDRKTTGMPNLL